VNKIFLQILFPIVLLGFGSLPIWAQTDVAANLFGAFSGVTSGNGVQESPSNTAGTLIEVRHIKNPLAGFEANYSYNRANQTYTNLSAPCAATGASSCTTTTAAISANAHEFSGDWVPSLKVAELRLFASLGGGVLFDVPSGGTITTTTCALLNPLCSSSTSSASLGTQTKAVFDYGAGVDWRLSPRIGLRFQYRGDLYKVPPILNGFYSTDALTHAAEPMIGAYFRL
jgi:opacity protein-like surface antigen